MELNLAAIRLILEIEIARRVPDACDAVAYVDKTMIDNAIDGCVQPTQRSKCGIQNTDSRIPACL